LVGSFYLMWKHRTWRLRVLWQGRIIPHLYVVTKDGVRWHFKVVEDLLPPPLCFLWFMGRYEIMVF